MTNQRLVWPDAARGVLILIVILGHSLQHGDYENDMIWNMIYSFHMPAFFVISGYVSYKPEIRWNIVSKRAQQLLIPFTIWGIIHSLCLGKVGVEIFDFFLYPDRGYWFVYTLFFIIVLTVLVELISKIIHVNRTIILFFENILLIALMAVFDWRICGLQFISFYFFFYILGSFIRKYDIKITQSLCLFLGASWLLTAIFWKGHEIPVPLLGFDMVPATILIYGYRYLSATLGALFLIGLSPYCFTELDNYLNKALCYLGTSSLGIYIVHMFVAHMLDYYHLIEKYFDSTTSMSYTLTFYIICAVSGIGLTYVLSQNRCFCYLFLGKCKVE